MFILKFLFFLACSGAFIALLAKTTGKNKKQYHCERNGRDRSHKD
tara:strand:- start:30347 stop:30481 length:135 start_codon:yes stop_codon:yes gene_type:complete